MQIVDDLLSKDIRIRQVVAVFQAAVFEPEDVEVQFVPFKDLVVGEAAPTAVGVLMLRPIAAAFGVWLARFVEFDELVQVGAFEWIGLEREVLVGAEVLDP